MAPAGHRSFQVNVLLSQFTINDDPSSITVSKDIYDEARTWNEQRYIALSTRQSNEWRLYVVRSAPSTSVNSHSTVWLPSGMYKLFCDQTVFARPARPIELSSVLLSFPKATYHIIKANTESLQSFVQTGHVFRTGETIDVNGYRGEVTLCEPVRQGVVSSATEFVLAREQASEHEHDSHSFDALADNDHQEDDDAMQFSYLLDASVNGGAAAGLQTDHLHYSVSTTTETNPRMVTIDCKPLDRPVLHDQISPSVAKDEDDHHYAFADITLLIDLGYFSGDSVELFVDQAQKVPARVFRIFSLPADYANARQDALYLSPVMHHNLLGGFSVTVGKTFIRARTGQCHYSVAKAVTLGRVPSPASTDRALQNAFFHALKLHFEVSKRIVRLGDLILLGIDETLARVTATDDQDQGLISEFSQSFTQGRVDTFAWFKVVKVEIEDDEAFAGDVQVDAASTRMVQSGTEKARVPPTQQWASYYGLPDQIKFSAEDGTNYAKLLQLIQATFGKTARKARACASVLLHGTRGSGKKTIVSGVASALGMHFLDVNCYDIIGETDLKTEAYLRLRFEKAGQCAPCLLLLRNIGALAKKKDDMESGQESTMRFILADCLSSVAIEAGSAYPVAVVATTANKDEVPEGVLGCFRHELEVGAPEESERLSILQNLTKSLPLAPDVSVQSLAVRSAALVAADLVSVVRRAQNYSQDRMDRLALALDAGSSADLQVAGAWINSQDFDQAIGEARRNYSDSIGAPKIPNVTWDDVGGLASVKDDIMDTIQLPLERPDLFASGMKKRSGILFYGPPGTGKTLFAKAVATSFSLNFFSVKGPELLNMYIGESEANVRRVFQRARDAKPCVVFFDELDSVAPKRGNQGDSGGVMDRIVSQLLSELDGMSEGQDGGGGGVFVIGATNRPDLLDPALLRPGRFDKMLYLGVSDTDEAQYNILLALTRKFKLEATLDLRDVARVCPYTYTGADFYALCSDAMLKAMTRRASLVDAKVKALDPPRSTQYFFDHFATKEDVQVVVEKVDFMDALKELVPSVSQSELDHYKKVQAQFSPVPAHVEEENKVMVDNKGKDKVVSHANGTNGTNGQFRQDEDQDEELYA